MELLNIELKLMATLWENTYRAAMKDHNGNYLATARLIVNIPLPQEALPPNAPAVGPQLFVLVEDAVIDSDHIIDFESILAARLREQFKYEIDHIFFFYPSPEDVLSKTVNA